ncbi:Uma2 family endonuclease [Phormidesmis priestleyi]|uniref:Uma2 family endonuclease n=1 Tax=Phormidesmis priestleyi TaxID=268141 RepID=UPI00083B02B0|nr:Uma2 family endonuclease [Phormidesmis priestleyi]
MTLSIDQLDIENLYPDSDGLPMAESDPARDYLLYSVEALSLYFQARSDVYVSGNLFIYYKRGVPDAVVAPDVFVIFGVENKKRRSYKVWEEDGKLPAFVLEITSKTTQENDEEDKPKKYQSLGVLEYFQYDPTGDYLRPHLKGVRLIENRYVPIASHFSNNTFSLHSQTLGLDLRLIDGELRFYEPETDKRLLSHAELDAARQQAEEARQQAEQAQQQAVPRLLRLGLTEEQVAEALSLSVEEVDRFKN